MKYYFDLLWYPAYMWMKYFIIVCIGKDPVIMTKTGENWSIHPRSIRNLEFNIENIMFTCSVAGIPYDIIVSRKDILAFIAQEKG